MTDHAILADVIRQLDSRTAQARRFEIENRQLLADVSNKRAQLFRAAALLKLAAARMDLMLDESDLVPDIGLFLVEIGE